MINAYEVVVWSKELCMLTSVCFTQTEADARRVVEAIEAKGDDSAHYTPVGVYDSVETELFIMKTYGYES